MDGPQFKFTAIRWEKVSSFAIIEHRAIIVKYDNPHYPLFHLLPLILERKPFEDCKYLIMQSLVEFVY